jgi:C4-dicarboxylate transporter DctQ subunit
LNKVLNHLEEWLIAFMMGAATIVIFVSVAHRYASGIPWVALQDWLLTINLSWAQELCIYMFIWMAKFGAAYGVRTGIHVGVDVLVNQLQDKTRARFVIFGLLAGALFTGIIGTLGAKFVWEIAHTDQVSPDMELPMWIAFLAIPCGSYLMCFRFLQVSWSFWSTGELPHHDHGYVEGVEAVKDEDIVAYALKDNLHPRDVDMGKAK